MIEEFARRGPFTALVILVSIRDSAVDPLASSYVNVVGDDIAWPEIVALFAGSGMDWHGASFYPVASPGGDPLGDAEARVRLGEWEARVRQERLALNEGHFFDRHGRRMVIEEVAAE